MSLGRQTLNKIHILQVSSDPTTGSGQKAPLGSLAASTFGGIWQKRGSSDTDWLSVSPVIIAGLAESQTVTESGGNVTALTFYRSLTQITANRLASVSITYTSSLPTSEVWTIFQSDGTTTMATITISHTWSGNSLTNSQQVVS